MEILSSLRRRWILASLLLVLSLAGTVYALLKLPSTYQSQSSIVLLVPKNVAKTVGGNPYLAFNSTLNETADVVRYETMDVRTVNSLAQAGYTSTYLVTDAIDTAGPVLVITVTGKSQPVVEHTLHGVTSEVSMKLSDLQVGITAPNRIRDAVITFTPKAIVLPSKKTRPLSVVAGAGFLLTVGIPLIVDALIMRRRSTQETLRPEEPARPQVRRGPAVTAPGRDPRKIAISTPDDGFVPAEDEGYRPHPQRIRPPGQPARRP